jgi:hypothetical protein
MGRTVPVNTPSHNPPGLTKLKLISSDLKLSLFLPSLHVIIHFLNNTAARRKDTNLLVAHAFKEFPELN